jgi:hypothetical protein
MIEDKINNKINTKIGTEVIVKDKHNFFNRGKIQNITMDVFRVNLDEVITILRNAFLIKDIPILDKNDIVLHIRSGDIFDKNPHPNYIVPPLSYYNRILSSGNYNKIIIVAEDTKNPVINELIKLYPNIDHKKQNLVDDIKIILGTSKIVTSFGTFIPFLLLFSKEIKDVYKPSYQQSLHSSLRGVHIHDTDLTEYRLHLHPWKNTKEQRDYIINHGKTGNVERCAVISLRNMIFQE